MKYERKSKGVKKMKKDGIDGIGWKRKKMIGE